MFIINSEQYIILLTLLHAIIHVITLTVYYLYGNPGKFIRQ